MKISQKKTSTEKNRPIWVSAGVVIGFLILCAIAGSVLIGSGAGQ